MATLILTASDLKLTSGYYVRERVVGYMSGGSEVVETYCTTPSTAKGTRSFSLSGLPAGSIIHSAVLSGSRSSTASGTRRIDGAVASLPLTIAASRIVPGKSLNIEFSWQATGNASLSTGYHNAHLTYTGLKLTIEYTGYTQCTAPTAVTLSKTEATPGESLTLSWSGAKGGLNAPISGYEIHRANGVNGAYSLLATVGASALSCAVTAPESAGSYAFRVKALSTVTGYASALSAASAAVSVRATPPSAPTNVAVSPQSQYPEGAATLSWTAPADGENNPVTGYAVYQAAAPDGPWSFLKNADTASCSVTAPQGGERYFRVAALGRYLDSAPSAAAALAADLSGTSDFSMLGAVIDAGEALTVYPESVLDQPHTLTVVCGLQSVSAQGAAGAESISVVLPLDWLCQMTDSDTRYVSVRLTTQGAGTMIHEATLRCPDSIVPTGMDGSAAPVSQTVPAAWGVLAANLSAAQITFDTAAAAPYGAAIAGYRIDGPGVHVEGDSLPLSGVSHLLPEGTALYVLSATDTRGRTGTKTIAVTVLPYAPPALQNILSLRADGQGEEADEGTYVLSSAGIVFSSLDGHNAAQCLVAYRLQGASAWTNAGALSDGELLFGGGSIALSSNWEIRYTVSDSLGRENVYYDLVTRAQWELHVKRGGGAWAFGGVADVDGALHVYGSLQVDGPAITETNGAMGIVENGDTAVHTIGKDAFVMWKGLLCTADAAIPAGSALALSGAGKNLTAAPSGGFNALNDDIGVLSSRLAQFLSMRVFTSTVPKNGKRVIRGPSGKNLPCLIFTYYAQGGAYLSGTFAIVGDGVTEGTAKMASLFTPGSSINVRTGVSGGTNYTSVVIENSSTNYDVRLILISLNSMETITFA